MSLLNRTRHLASSAVRMSDVEARIGHHASTGSILSNMKVATGKVVGGKIVLDGVSFEEGTSVTVLASDDDGSFELTPEQEAELLLSIAEAERGETVSAEEVLAKLSRRHG